MAKSTSMQKFSSQMEREVLAEVRRYARESNRRLSEVLTEAARAHLDRIRIRPAFRKAAEEVLDEIKALLKRLAE
jgi:hypothetical protein